MLNKSLDFEFGKFLKEEADIWDFRRLHKLRHGSGMLVGERVDYALEVSVAELPRWLEQGLLRVFRDTMKYPRELMVGRDRSGNASFDEVEVSGAVGTVDVCGEGEDLTVHLEGTVCCYEGA